MIKKPEEFILDTRRNLENSSFILKLYTGWALAAFILFGVIGIYKQVSDLTKKNSVIKEISVLNDSLRKKIEVIGNEKAKIDKNTEGVNFLNRYLPDDYGTEDYIVDFSFSVAEKGFKFKSYTQQNVSEDSHTIDATVDLEGSGDFGGLLSNIESLKRIAQVKKIDVRNVQRGYAVNVLLNIYVMK